MNCFRGQIFAVAFCFVATCTLSSYGQKTDELSDDFRKAFEAAYAPLQFTGQIPPKTQNPQRRPVGSDTVKVFREPVASIVKKTNEPSPSRSPDQTEINSAATNAGFALPASAVPLSHDQRSASPHYTAQQENVPVTVAPTSIVRPVFDLAPPLTSPAHSANNRWVEFSAAEPDDSQFQFRIASQTDVDLGTNLLVQAPASPAAPEIDNRENRDQENIQQRESDLWWLPLISQPFGDRRPEEVHPQMLVHQTIKNSPRVLAISQQPLVQETQIGESRAEFDPDLFLKSQFEDRTDPTGNTLQAGGLPFLEDHIWFAESGFRKKTYNGARLEIAQRFGFQNSNSPFFDPQDQGTATLSLDFSQPLLRGRGKYYNRSQIMIAQVSSGVAWDQFAAELRDELTEVLDAYWTLYQTRSVLLQKQRNVERGQMILDRLEGRSGLDSLPSQIARARAAVQSRQTELANARRDVRNAETEIRRLVAAPDAFQQVGAELLPIEMPNIDYLATDPDDLIAHAMEKRPEVREALKRAKIAAIQRNVTKNELLPELNLIFNTYVSALEADSDVMTAWAQQFADSTPGYGIGLEFAVPYRRRAAKARYTRQQLIVLQIQNEVNEVLLQVVSEVQIAWRRVESAHQTLQAAKAAIQAGRADLEQNESRWEAFGLVEGDLAEGQTPTTLLDQLLDAQQRLANSELTFSQALLEFKVSEVQLKKASGNLLNHQQVRFSQVCGPEGPEVQIDSDHR